MPCTPVYFSQYSAGPKKHACQWHRTSKLMHTPVFTQGACGQAWVLYDVAILAAMLICVITYSIYIQSLADFQPHDTYPVYDSLGGAQAHLLLPKKQESSTYNGETCSFTLEFHMHPLH